MSSPLNPVMRSDTTHGWLLQISLKILPPLSVFMLLLLALVPMRLPTSWAAGGLWPMLGLFYWGLVQPRAMPISFVFCIGLLCDLALNMALGCYALVFILLHVVLTTQRRFLVGQGFWLVWPAFAMTVLIVYTLVFVLQHGVTVMPFTLQDWESGLPAAGIVILAFPVLLPLLHGLQRLIAAHA